MGSTSAAAVVRAALEAEKPSESNRFEERRRGDLFLIALSTIPYGEPALEYAEKLGEAEPHSPQRPPTSKLDLAC